MSKKILIIVAIIFAFAMIESANAKSSSRRYHMKYFKRDSDLENYEAVRERLRADLYRKLLEALTNERSINDSEDSSDDRLVVPDHGENINNSEDSVNSVSKRRFLKS